MQSTISANRICSLLVIYGRDVTSNRLASDGGVDPLKASWSFDRMDRYGCRPLMPLELPLDLTVNYIHHIVSTCELFTNSWMGVSRKVSISDGFIDACSQSSDVRTDSSFTRRAFTSLNLPGFSNIFVQQQSTNEDCLLQKLRMIDWQRTI